MVRPLVLARHLPRHCFQQPTKRSFADVPDRSNVVIVGGGIIGTSVAYHLAKIGVEDVLLLERDRVTSGTTWHAAGLMSSFGSLSRTSTWMRRYTQELYRDILPHETDLSTGWKPIGFIELACDEDRVYDFRRIAAFNRLCGVVVEEITPHQVLDKFPLCHVSDVMAGFYVAEDGRANPTDATMALAKGARMYGATLREQCPVKGVKTNKYNGVGGLPMVSGVVLADGHEIQCNAVVNCAGMWARQWAEACGVHNIPNQAAEHYYLITEPIEGVDPSWPVLEDPSRCVYIRPEGAGLMLGLFELEGAAWRPEGIPENFSFGEIQPDWDRMMPYVEAAMERVPAVKDAGIRALFCGPESFTPDNSPIVGESSELRNYFVAAGLNSIGILTGGGIGYILSRWIKDGMAPSDVDVTGINANRFHRYQNNPSYRQARVGEALGNTYRTHYPDHQPQTCRNCKQSPFHERLARAGAYFRDVSGWESPAWYAPEGRVPIADKESFGREHWFSSWREEHLNCRQNVALFDMSFMSKILVQGADAGSFLNRLSTANVDGAAGRITYTQWLNERGFMEADLTVTKLRDDQFLVVATDTMHNHVHDHMLRRLTKEQHVCVTDVTARYAQLNLQGPRSRELLQQLTSVDMNDFVFRQAAELDLELARVLCTRITYVGELGYELFIPVEQAHLVYDNIVKVGAEYGLRHAGLKALGSLRLEKGYRDYGHDIDNTDTLLECGLGFTCDFEKVEPFVGQAHVLAQKALRGLRRRLVSVLLDDSEPLLHGGEILWCNDQPLADIRSASYGHSLGAAIGLAMVENLHAFITKTDLQKGVWYVQIGRDLVPSTVSLRPFYDPQNLKLNV